MNTHTQGPWTVCPGDSRFVSMPDIVKPVNAGNRANARLIAAAPELLEALRDLCAYTENLLRGFSAPSGETVTPQQLSSARAAIAKAESA